MEPSAGPVFVGATGGSGTRVIQGILASTGIPMGDVNHTADALAFVPLYDDYINAVLSYTRSLDYDVAEVPEPLRGAILGRMRQAATQHCGGRALDRGWGAKNPRSSFLMPFVHALWPACSFLHVIRDGRDMALSGNQRQAGLHHAALTGRPFPTVPGVAAAEVWAQANTEIAAWGRRVLGDRYLLVRFEDLCAHPAEIAGEIADFLGRPVDRASVVRAVSPPASIGRWKTAPDASMRPIREALGDSIERFGYEGAPTVS